MVNGKNENHGYVNKNGLDRNQEIALQNTINQYSNFRNSQDAAENGENSEIGENSLTISSTNSSSQNLDEKENNKTKKNRSFNSISNSPMIYVRKQNVSLTTIV